MKTKLYCRFLELFKNNESKSVTYSADNPFFWLKLTDCGNGFYTAEIPGDLKEFISIIDCAEWVCRTINHKWLNKVFFSFDIHIYTPLYKNSVNCAVERNEFTDFKKSNIVNELCNSYVSNNYGRFYNYEKHTFDVRRFTEYILYHFGIERTTYIIAGYVSERDRRYSQICRNEAVKYQLPQKYYTHMHPTLVNAVFEYLIEMNEELKRTNRKKVNDI